MCGLGVYMGKIPVWISPVWDRVWVTLSLASAMIISHSSVVGGSRSPCALIYTYVYFLKCSPKGKCGLMRAIHSLVYFFLDLCDPCNMCDPSLVWRLPCLCD